MKFLNNIDLQKNEIQNFRVQNLASAPQNPVAGQHYFDTVKNTEYVFDGTKWIDALSQGDYTFKDGITENANREVFLTAATTEAIGGVIIGTNIDVDAGTISVKSGNKTQAGLLGLAADADVKPEATEDAKAITPKQADGLIDTKIADKIELTDISATGPITYDNTTGVISATYDNAPTADSDNLVKSGAIQAAIKAVNDGAVIDVELKENTKDTLTVTKGDGTSADIKIAKVDEAANITGLTATAAELNEVHESGVQKADLVKLHDITATAAEVNKLAGNDVTADDLTKLHNVTATAAEINKLAGNEVTADDLTKLHGVTADKDELNVLDGITATTAELNELHEGTATKADFIKLHGLTSTAAEINELHEAEAVKADFVKLHAITATAAEINAMAGAGVDAEDLEKLAAITASAEEINKLDGATVTTEELNQLHESGVEKADLTKLHNVTATAAEINKLTGNEVTADDLTKLHGVTADKDELNILDGATITTTELNRLAGVTDDVQTQLDDKIPLGQKGAANGVATLDANGLVPAAQLPAYVDDVIDLLDATDTAPAACKAGDKYYNSTDKKIYVATAENTWAAEGTDPEADKIYVNVANNMSYRWSGTTLVQIGADKLKGFNGTIVGDGTTTTFTINHNLGTRNVVFEIYEATAPFEKVYVQVLHTSTTALQVIFSIAPEVGTDYTVTCIAIA